MKRTINIIAFLAFQFAASVNGQDASNYLIISDIGSFVVSGDPSVGKGPGILASANHFYRDHTDMVYEIDYFNLQTRVGPEVQITQHAGSDSDKWLLHELNRDFRNYYGIPGRSYGPRVINGQTILEDLVGGGHYRWISGSKVISIEYRDAQMTKPEPIEVIQAYLAKHPSTLTGMTLTQLRSTEYKTTWIKDEMDRRLWLCDKWFMQLQLKKIEEKQVYQESVKSMNIFLDYREKYYGMKAADEKNLLAGYLTQNNGTGIKAKLKEYKDWWVVNKDKQISIP
jgi:hypothetical protein